MMDLEDQQRFRLEGEISTEPPDLWLTCNRCDWVTAFDEPITLAELNRRADEHTEECR